MRNKNKKVIAAISGGVDSGVAAALLKRAGFKVSGVFLKLADLPRFKDGEKRAKKIAKNLEIPFSTFNFKKEFKKRIINEFLKEHRKGATPNPCVICNKEIKLGLLLEKAVKAGADYLATGHYVRTRRDKDITRLLKGKDGAKDQSYFLWKLNQSQLRKILFPLGNYKKTEVRKLAKKMGFLVSSISESQEVCFIPRTVNDFLRKHLKGRKGKIVDVNGKTLGYHQGLIFYTVGQRKGIRLAGGPYYVLGKNLKKNFLIVTKNKKDLCKKELIARDVNWISGKEPKFPLKIRAKIRYRQRLTAAAVSKMKNNRCKIQFEKSQRAVTSGQSVVFYSGEEVLGGGIIC